MQVYYALKHPDGTKSFDYWLLKQAHLARKFYVGTYYIPSKKMYTAVFKRIALPTRGRSSRLPQTS